MAGCDDFQLLGVDRLFLRNFNDKITAKSSLFLLIEFATSTLKLK